MTWSIGPSNANAAINSLTSLALDFRFDLNLLRLEDNNGVGEGAVGVVGSGWVIAVDGSVIGGMVALLDESLASTSKVSLPISVLNIIKCS